MALAGLFQNIGVDDAAEAKAVIDKILNQRTSELTPQQQGMLGTGIYRDISEQLDVKDAAGNQITRTSKVALPSGQIVESGLPNDIFTNPKEARTKSFLKKYIKNI